MQLAKLVLKVVADIKDMRAGLDSAAGKARGFASSVGGNFLSLGNKVLKFGALAGGTALLGIGALGGGLAQLAVDAAPLQTIQEAFEGISEASGQSSADLLRDLQEQSAGMITNRDLMEKYNLAAQLVGDQFANQLPAAMGPLGKVAAATGQDMGFLMDSLVRGVGRLSPMILDNLAVQIDLNSAYEAWAAANGVAVGEMTKSQQQAAVMAATMEQLEKNTASMPEVVGSAAQQFAAFQTTLQNTKDQIGLAVLPAITPLISKLSELAAEHLPGIVDAMTPFLEQFGTFTELLLAGDLAGALGMIFPEDVVNRIIEIKDAIMDFVNNTMLPFIEEHAEEFKGAFIAIGAVLAAAGIVAAIVAIVSAINPVTLVIVGLIALVGVLGAAWAGNWGGIQEKTQTAIDFIKGVIDGGLAFISGLWESNFGLIRTTIENNLAFYSAIFAAFKSAFEGDWRGFGENLKVAWNAFWRQIGDILRTAGRNILNAIRTIVTTVINFFRNTDWGSVGRNIISGIASGISASLGVIRSAATSAASAALEAAKGFLGIRSRSRVFENQVGMEIGAGTGFGIERSIAQVARNLDSVFGQLVPAAAGATAGGFAGAQAGGDRNITFEAGSITIKNKSDAQTLIKELARELG
ncbi:MAG: hypothetical protein DWQ07_12795 [Chloroflexi bacterium]|nr:MAG: hypothetical protein DWQ07_12795 [Chloroflexota bacterium]MBL1196917.1 hypothetical protein [Chloroflexota bacterium]NOH14213.1 hypothetical protein [Chloroflexota bacterium]